MLRMLSGRQHEVISGVCLRRQDGLACESIVTRVWFATLSPEEVAAYVATGEPMDKAGAYAIQGMASRYITRIEGSYANVVGLPIDWVYRNLGSRNVVQ
jgi:septum formation protein